MNDLEKLQELMMNNNKKMIEALKSTDEALRKMLYNTQEGSTELYFGSLMVKGGIVQIPEDPTGTGDMISYNRPDIMITDTKPGFEIKWLHLKDNIYICDRGLVNRVSWNTLREAGYINGKEVMIDGKRCLIRLMTESNRSKGSYGAGCDNEWNQLVNKYERNNKLIHYKGMYTWCKEDNCNISVCRPVRGYNTADCYYSCYASYTGSDVAFRPVLEILTTEGEDHEE